MKFTTSVVVVVSTIVASSSALPQNPVNSLLGALGLNGLLGNGTPPLATTIHSPECANTNGGTYICCESTFDGGLPIVKELSELSDYPITKNTISGLVDCKILYSPYEQCSGSKLCCGSIALMPAAAIYCQSAQ